MIAAHLARRRADYVSAFVLLVGTLFGFGVIAGWVALCSAGLLVTAQEIFTRRRSTESEQARERRLAGADAPDRSVRKLTDG